MKSSSPSIAILGLGTAVPPYRVDQLDAARRLAEALGEKTEEARWAKRLFRNCGVDTRYTCEQSLLEPVERCRFMPGTPLDQVPTTAERMKIYQEQSPPLALEAAGIALADSNSAPNDITHLITISCTGQFLPGLDTILMEQLGLSAHVQRMPLTFLGCAAGMSAIRIARQIAALDSSYKILIVSVELCTLHIQPSSDRQSLFATGFFGDGAASCVIGTPDTKSQGIFELSEGRTVIFPDTKPHMVWTVGNYGFDLYLSPQIPELLAQFAPPEMKQLIGDGPAPDLWAIHPGGRGIIDVLQKLFALTDDQTKESRTILRQYGNVSSATILFVLNEMKQQRKVGLDRPLAGIAVAFGPGLNAEIIRYTYHAPTAMGGTS